MPRNIKHGSSVAVCEVYRCRGDDVRRVELEEETLRSFAIHQLYCLLDHRGNALAFGCAVGVALAVECQCEVTSEYPQRLGDASYRTVVENRNKLVGKTCLRLLGLCIGFNCVLLGFRRRHLDLAVQQGSQSHVGSKLGKGHDAIG